MKTITTTFHYGTNYGAVLQTYALHKTILKLGHENLVLDTEQSRSPIPENHSLYSIASELYIKYLSFLRNSKLIRLNKHFADFKKNNILLTRPYKDMNDLRKDELANSADCLITGSDQVWNLKSRPEMVDSRLLLFGKSECIRFSYAASLEEQNYSEKEKDYVKTALSQFKGIGVREKSACNYIESITGRNCRRVIDPVFLLTREDWNSISVQPRLSGPYILCYQVQRNKRMEEVAHYLKNKTGYPIVSICKDAIRWMKSDYYYHDVSIEEFLGFYENAAYVVSASFHGVAMGLVFNKPVYAMVKKARANRLRDIMNVMGLDKYIIDQDAQLDIRDYSEEDIVNYRRICDSERTDGVNFLNDMLK